MTTYYEINKEKILKARKIRYENGLKIQRAERLRQKKLLYPELFPYEGESDEQFKRRRSLERNKKYVTKHQHRVKKSKIDWKNNNAEYDTSYYKLNSDKIRNRVNAYKKRNPSLVRWQNANRRLAVRQSTPRWCNKEEIKKIYQIAYEYELLTGIPHHVDHIIPLKGKNVCGLHIPNNLQILTKEENLKKGNRLVP